MRRLAAVFIGILVPLAPAAAAPICSLPARLPPPQEEGASAREPSRIVPISGYTLSLIWLAENCRKGHSSGAGALDCRARAGKDGVVLHGLWPDGIGKEWPQWCRPARPLRATTLRAHYCATPSAQLAQHEWAKHGTCMPGYDAERYLARARALFAELQMPHLRALSYGKPTDATVRAAFAAANPGMTADMIRLNVTNDGWLEEIWVCLDARMRRTACAAPSAKPEARVNIWRGRVRVPT